jgi:SsrA-binding protein
MKVITVNRKAHRDYSLERKFEAGMVLTGSELKSIREGQVNLKDSYVGIRNMEAFLINSHIAEYKNASYNNHEPGRKRKLLLHKKEIRKLEKNLTTRGYSLIPLKMYFNDKGKVKVEIALAKGKREYEKKQRIKDRDVQRDMERELKSYK